MKINRHIDQLDTILSGYEDIIAEDYTGYRNHVYRMVHFCLALRDMDEDEQRKVYIAAAFHDIGIWLQNTVDYIEPSIPPAMQYLQDNQLQHWGDEIARMISEHHKVREYVDETMPLVEVFRRGDLVDFSHGLFRFGIDKAFIDSVQDAFPNAGFHKSLARRAGKWFIKHPFNPLPMMKL
ncbi:HD domain-containing protein [Thalassotalea mangrovi]|uniref:HD domain-containing protein n=1 Tax=Thalassotalea mangrovi TaxID=2572245 RepID=A0A4U1B2J1_9GAMM|nr:HD domain-containing protein [Thalassotalea mangrovi]TKB43328.1 hypothetical protein E8M12_15125 [Thalassotalea mangrovi]